MAYALFYLLSANELAFLVHDFIQQQDAGHM